jgi:hypothetical protein
VYPAHKEAKHTSRLGLCWSSRRSWAADLGHAAFRELRTGEVRRILPYPVKTQAPRGSNYYIAGKAFCDFHGIETGVSRRYVARKYGDDVLGIDLNDEPVKSNVTRARKEENVT